jgi:hypothetical protein
MLIYTTTSPSPVYHNTIVVKSFTYIRFKAVHPCKSLRQQHILLAQLILFLLPSRWLLDSLRNLPPPIPKRCTQQRTLSTRMSSKTTSCKPSRPQRITELVYTNIPPAWAENAVAAVDEVLSAGSEIQNISFLVTFYLPSVPRKHYNSITQVFWVRVMPSELHGTH